MVQKVICIDQKLHCDLNYFRMGFECLFFFCVLKHEQLLHSSDNLDLLMIKSLPASGLQTDIVTDT